MITIPFDRTPVDDPATLGVEAAPLAALLSRVRREIDGGLLPSCQIALARDGRLAVWESYGDAAPGSSYVIFSATKALVAGGVWMLIGEGRLDVTARVADLIPEFATNGKEVVTVEQVMLHTAGFPAAPMAPPEWLDRSLRLKRFSQWRLNWEPGSKYEYHPTSAHWVLGELIERISGIDFRLFLRDRITGPLGLDGLRLGVPVEEQRSLDINDLVTTGELATPEEIKDVFGIDELPATEVTPDALLAFNIPEARAAGMPGAGGLSTAADLALYYQALLHNPGDMWSPDVLADVTSHVRCTMPDYLGVPANRSLGLVLAGDDGRAHLRGMGHTVSPRAFGHNGAAGQIAWADPDTGLSFCYLTNGVELHQIREARRTSGIASRAGVCAPR
ncbi:MAG: beta-lactamase family protein [Acidimicrobiia bacterium]|nr:beta-lactamase family protein [Acidimicrobiia bacterium]